MNYIKELCQELAEVRIELMGLKCGLTDLSKYLTSTKFHEDPTVQVQDVLNRLAEAYTLSNNIRAEQESLHHNLNKENGQ